MAGSRIYDHSLLSYCKGHQEVSLSIMTLLYQELIQNAYKHSDSIEQFQFKLTRIGYRLGVDILELVNYRSSVPQSILNKFKESSNASTSTSKSIETISNSSTTTNTTSPTTTTTATTIGTTAASTTAINTGITSSSSLGTANTNAIGYSNPTNGMNYIEDKEYVSIGKDIPKMKRRDLKIIDILQFIHGTVWSYLFGHVSDDLMKSQENDTEYRIIDNEPQWTQFISGSKRNQVHYESCNYMLCGLIQGYLCESGFPCNVTAHWQPVVQYPQRIVFVIQFQQDVVTREQLRYNSRS